VAADRLQHVIGHAEFGELGDDSVPRLALDELALPVLHD
jgi:hypothetical protein